MATRYATSFRLTDADLARLDELGRRWGPVQPMDRTATFREAVRRCLATEQQTATPNRKNRRQETGR